MSIKVEEKEIKQPTLINKRITGATCDRCGGSAFCANDNVRPGLRGGGPWCEVEALIQGGGRYHADLCLDCSEKLRKWIGGGEERPG